jgi:hypothetical protein
MQLIKKTAWYFVLLFIVTLVHSCSIKSKQFTKLSAKRTGIEFRNIIKETENFNHLEYSYLYNGGGVAIGDINNDGLPDLFFAGNLAKCRLYLNKGNLKFEDITKKAGVSSKETWNNGVTMADINGDGFVDIYVCSSTDDRPIYRRNLLYINNGDLTFSEKATEYGIGDPAYSTHSTFFDYDKDGDLDLFVLNHSVDKYAMFTKKSAEYKKKQSSEYGEKFYINLGNRFVDATKETGIHSNVINFGLGVAVADFNNDKWPDIYVCNDYYENDYFYMNQKDGTFSEQMRDYFSHISFSSMGNDAADINNDGFIDLFTLDMLPNENVEQKLVAGPHNYEKYKLLEKRGFYHQTTRNMLQLNNYGKFFTEIGQYAGIFSTNWSWSPLICDYDNDGLKDIFISNGYGKNNTHMDVLSLFVEDMKKHKQGKKGMSNMEFVEKVPATILKNYMFKNNGDLTFTNVCDDWGFETKTLSNGTAYADLDNDGDMDLVINNINEYASIYRNNANRISDNHYLRIKLKGSGKNTGGIGARIDVSCGKKTFTQEFYPSRGYMSSMGHTLVFGLGEAVTVDDLTVTWPDLRVQTLSNINADQTITLDNEEARIEEPEPKKVYQTIFKPLKDEEIIQYRHVENDFIDFKKQSLLPFLLSTQGPFITKGDVNNDGLTDLFIGGAKDSPGSMFFQRKDNTFELQKMECFLNDQGSEDIGVLFIDVDGDKDLDLYVVSGGNEYTLTSKELKDRLYLNDGSGSFSKSKNHLPEMISSGSCVKSGDIDNDGDIDLFIGGRLIPGLYPIAPRSYILENDGMGYFSDVTKEKCNELLNPGMVTDAQWVDFSGDGLIDLVVVGRWMPIRLFLNTGSKLKEVTGKDMLDHSKGWWNRIVAKDFDKDGDVDFVIGNFGLNSEIKASVDEPVRIYAKDFDSNSSLDAIMCYYINGKSYPLYSRDELAAQIESIYEKYPDYKSYADQTISDLFSKKSLDDALVLTATNFNSSYLENLGDNKFELSSLPFSAQLSPVYAIEPGDFNKDGNIDLILAGNFFGTRIRYGRYDANKGVLLMGDGHGHFKEVPNIQSGLYIKGEVKDITELKINSGNKLMIFSLNNDEIKLYKF